jgi:hypothetical protein
LRMSIVYLAWCTKVPSLACLIWSPRKNCNYPIIDISNSLLMSSSNLVTKEWDKPPKTISSTYTWTIRIISPPEEKKSLINLAHLKPLAEQ